MPYFGKCLTTLVTVFIAGDGERPDGHEPGAVAGAGRADDARQRRRRPRLRRHLPRRETPHLPRGEK